MASSDIIGLLRQYCQELLNSRIPVKGLVLYGSFARGDARQTSDIDVMVLLENGLSREQIFEIWPELDFCAHKVDIRIETWPVTVSRYETDEVSPLILTARQEGIRIAV